MTQNSLLRFICGQLSERPFAPSETLCAYGDKGFWRKYARDYRVVAFILPRLILLFWNEY